MDNPFGMEIHDEVEDGITNVVPTMPTDTKVHVMGTKCWCNPLQMFSGDTIVRIVHRPFVPVAAAGKFYE